MSTTVGRVDQLWRFPVKSLQGERVDSLTFDDSHAAGDREWAFFDVASGKALSAKRWPPLLFGAARSEAGGTVVVTLPDGTELEAGDPGLDGAASAWLGHEVALRRPSETAGAPFEMYTDPTDDASPTFDFATPPGHFGDLASAHLLTDVSLAAAAALHPDGDWDVRRFRPTAFIALAGGEGFVEDAWIGEAVEIGTAAFSPFMPTVRCSMPTRAQPGLDRDADIARTLSRHHDLNLGVYCSLARPGRLSVGDDVRV